MLSDYRGARSPAAIFGHPIHPSHVVFPIKTANRLRRNPGRAVVLHCDIGQALRTERGASASPPAERAPAPDGAKNNLALGQSWQPRTVRLRCAAIELAVTFSVIYRTADLRGLPPAGRTGWRGRLAAHDRCLS